MLEKCMGICTVLIYMAFCTVLHINGNNYLIVMLNLNLKSIFSVLVAMAISIMRYSSLLIMGTIFLYIYIYIEYRLYIYIYIK